MGGVVTMNDIKIHSTNKHTQSIPSLMNQLTLNPFIDCRLTLTMEVLSTITIWWVGGATTTTCCCSNNHYQYSYTSSLYLIQ